MERSINAAAFLPGARLCELRRFVPVLYVGAAINGPQEVGMAVRETTAIGPVERASTVTALVFDSSATAL